jgi:hypothetical protein
MKNKVMGKALSWVLSAAMALTMSGAIPAMTSTVYATYYLQDVDGVSATGFYMPSFKEFVAAWSTDPTSTIGSATWTRDAVLSKAGSTYSATTKGAIIASDKSADVAADDTAYAYRPAVSIDLTKALFKVDNGDGSYHLVFVDSSLAKAPGFKAAVNATTTTTVSVNPKLGQLLIEF